jgi:hypothetical protein
MGNKHKDGKERHLRMDFVTVDPPLLKGAYIVPQPTPDGITAPYPKVGVLHKHSPTAAPLLHSKKSGVTIQSISQSHYCNAVYIKSQYVKE